ncbi:MAG: hypothetical protein JSR83_23200 [Proteobacteria bacterium]|nr:hypothetical protein [Pseudomonadota bacterium]
MPPSPLPPPPRPALKPKPVTPLPLGFLTRAAALPGGRTLAVALALCVQAASTGTNTITFSAWMRARFAISDDAALDALNRLSAAGLIEADRRRGRYAVVTLLIPNEGLLGVPV